MLKTPHHKPIEFVAASPSTPHRQVTAARGGLPLGRRSARKSGFTLLELLVVITIIVILAALIFTSSSRMIASARTATCAGNLRQISVAVMSFAGDNNMQLPPYIQNPDPESGASTLIEVLRRYTGEGEPESRIQLWECPEQTVLKKTSEDLTSGYSGNPRLLADSIGGSRVSMASVSRPDEVFLLIDAGQEAATGLAEAILSITESSGELDDRNKQMTGQPFMTPDTDLGSGAARYRHNERANVLFLDGHVEAIRKGAILQKNVFINY